MHKTGSKVVLCALFMVTSLFALPTAAQQINTTLVLFPEPESLTLYIPADQVISLDGVTLQVDHPSRGIVGYQLTQFPAFSGLDIDSLSPPVCFRLIEQGSNSVLPLDCQALPPEKRYIQQLNPGDIFWYDSTANQQFTLSLNRSGALIGLCPAELPRCSVLVTSFVAQMQSFETYQIMDEDTFEQTLAEFTLAIQLAPESASAYINRALVYASQGQWQFALADLTMAIELDAQNWIAYNNRAAIYRAIDLDERAIDDYTQAIRLNPDDAGIYWGRGTSYATLDRYEDALADFDIALTLSPDNPVYLSSRASAHRQLGNIDAALRDANRAIELAPNEMTTENAYMTRAYLAFAAQDYGAAIDDYTQVIDLNGSTDNRVVAYQNRGISYYLQGDNPRAANDFIAAMELDPAYPAAYAALGIIYQELGRNEDALRLLHTYEQLLNGNISDDIAQRILLLTALVGKGDGG